MDGDEDQRSSGVAVCDGGSEAGAEASGDAAPVAVEEEPPAATAEVAPVDDAPETATPAEDLVDEASNAPDGALAGAEADEGGVPAPAADDGAADADAPDDDALTEGALVDDTPDVLAEGGDSADHAESAPVAVSAADDVAMAVFDPPEVTRVAIAMPRAEATPRQRGAYLRRGVVALVAVGVVALAVTAFAWIAPSPEAANQRFVDAAESQGHAVTSDEQQSLLVTAARKICDRRSISHSSDEERRATALTGAEIEAVDAAFGADTRDFTSLALKTFCSR